MNWKSDSAYILNPLPRITFPAAKICLLALALAMIGPSCATIAGPPRAKQLQTHDGRQNSILLLRVVTEVDGRTAPPFPSWLSLDDVWLGLGDFSSGGEIKSAPLRFLSAETRQEGWTYLLLQPGTYYLAAHEPVSTSASTYNAQWKTRPRWSVEVPAGARLCYGGTLYVPGRGRWMLFAPRRLAEFDRTRLEVRDESTLAQKIANQWFPTLLPISVALAKEHHVGDTIILQTPPGK